MHCRNGHPGRRYQQPTGRCAWPRAARCWCRASARIRLAETGTTGDFNAAGPDYALGMDAMLRGCQAVTGGRVDFTRVPPSFLEEHKVDFPIWVPPRDNAYAGYGQVSNARAIAAGLIFRPLATTIIDLLEWFRGLPAERQATLHAGITRDREAELLRIWHARAGA